MRLDCTTPILLAALAVGLCAGCSSGEPVDPGPVPVPPAGPRTLQFVRVPPIGSRAILDIDVDVDGRSAALVAEEASTVVELWVDEGAGWTSRTTFLSSPPQCVALEPGGARIFVGHNAGYRLVELGQPIPPPTQFILPTGYPGLSQIFSGHAHSCRWTPSAGGATILQAQGDDDGHGNLMKVDPDPPAGARGWAEVTATVRADGGDFRLANMAIYAMDVAPDGGPVTLSLRPRGSVPAQNLLVTGRPGDTVWTARADDAPAGEILVTFERSARGTATLYQDVVRGQWSATVSGAEGTSGEGPLTSVGTSGLIDVMDIAADGHLWLGGVRGLWRSTEPLR